MRRAIAAIAFLSVACLLPQGARAQVIDPFVVTGPSLELNLPPLLRVRVGPAPVINLAGPRVRVVQAAPPPPPPPPSAAPPPPSVRVYVVTPDEAPPPPPPPHRYRRRRRHRRVRRHVPQRLGLTVGAFVDTALYEKGQLAGGGANFRWRFARHWALTFSLSGMASCTRCNKDSDAVRSDVNWTIGGMYFFFPRYWITPYVRGAFVFNHATFKSEDADDYEAQVTQGGAEFGVGFEWRITQWLALFADANVLALGKMKAKNNEGEKIAVDEIPVDGDSERWKGIPRIKGDDVAARLRLGLVIKF